MEDEFVHNNPQNPTKEICVRLEEKFEDISLNMSILMFVRKTRPWSNKIKQMQKQNTEDTQYNRDTDIRGSLSVGYVHKRNFQVIPFYYPTNEGIQPTTHPL